MSQSCVELLPQDRLLRPTLFTKVVRLRTLPTLSTIVEQTALCIRAGDVLPSTTTVRTIILISIVVRARTTALQGLLIPLVSNLVRRVMCTDVVMTKLTRTNLVVSVIGRLPPNT